MRSAVGRPQATNWSGSAVSVILLEYILIPKVLIIYVALVISVYRVSNFDYANLARSSKRPSRMWGWYWVAGCGDRELGMRWRVMLELVGANGAVGVHEVGGGAAVAEYTPRMIGLTLAEGKRMLLAMQWHCHANPWADG
jgi:hypothetical protein